MSEDIYRKLAQRLDAIPNGFPATESGVEMKLLKKVFTPGEADLFCDLKLTPETAEQIAETFILPPARGGLAPPITQGKPLRAPFAEASRGS